MKGNWECAAGCGRIFKTGLSINNGVTVFFRVTRKGSHIFGISGVRKFWQAGI